jgi:hypothetical protein
MLPWQLKVIISLLIVLGVIGLILRLFFGCTILKDIADFGLILTLVALLAYVYYTYLLAKDAWTPSASFALKPYPNTPHHIAFILQNHSKQSLHCWCNLNATVYGQNVSLGGFYSGQTSFDLQPFGGGIGHFYIGDILSKASLTLANMKQTANTNNIKEQLYLNIEFWYKAVSVNVEIRNPHQPHYFDFTHDVMITDF